MVVDPDDRGLGPVCSFVGVRTGLSNRPLYIHTIITPSRQGPGELGWRS